MEGSDMNIGQVACHPEHAPVFLSSTEQAVVSALHRQLPPQFVLTDGTDAVEVCTSVGEAFQFKPRFVIKDLESPQSFPLEVMTPPALSLANRLKLKWIISAYEQRGQDFILLVIDVDTPDERRKRLLEEDGVRAIWAGDYDEAAQALAEFVADRAARDPAMGTRRL